MITTSLAIRFRPASVAKKEAPRGFFHHFCCPWKIHGKKEDSIWCVGPNFLVFGSWSFRCCWHLVDNIVHPTLRKSQRSRSRSHPFQEDSELRLVKRPKVVGQLLVLVCLGDFWRLRLGGKWTIKIWYRKGKRKHHLHSNVRTFGRGYVSFSGGHTFFKDGIDMN